tara:strand:- start:4317 stop:4664 length:348 start_codon:yes stop_codon:yes gene_type:complete
MSDEINIPPGNKYIKSKRNDPKAKIENAFGAFKKLLADKTHTKNQTSSYNKNVVSVLNRLMVAADELDSENPGEGIFGLIILSLRSTLKVKDNVVDLEVRVRDLEREISRLKKSK